MFTIRNLGGMALFLFGTTYLWLTPMFAKHGLSTKGLLWSITQVGSLLTLLGFTIATWRLFTKASWWDQVAIGSAILGFVVLIPYWIAAHNSGETTPVVERIDPRRRRGRCADLAYRARAGQLGQRARDGGQVRSQESKDDGFETRPFLKVRRAYLHVLEAGRSKNIIHGLIEIDRCDEGSTAAAASRAGRPRPVVHRFLNVGRRPRRSGGPDPDAYRLRNQLIMFHDVDVNTQIEVELAGQKIVQSLIVRAADRKSVEEICDEIRQGRRGDPSTERRDSGTIAQSVCRVPYAPLLGGR